MENDSDSDQRPSQERQQETGQPQMGDQTLSPEACRRHSDFVTNQLSSRSLSCIKEDNTRNMTDQKQLQLQQNSSGLSSSSGAPRLQAVAVAQQQQQQHRPQGRRHSDFSVVANASNGESCDRMRQYKKSTSIRSSFAKLARRRTSFASSTGTANSSGTAKRISERVSTWIKRRRSSLRSNTNSSGSDNTPFQNYWANVAKHNQQQQQQGDGATPLEYDNDNGNGHANNEDDPNREDENENTNSETYPGQKILISSQTSMKLYTRSFLRIMRVALQHKSIILPTLITFTILCASGLAIVFLFAKDKEDTSYRYTQGLVEEMGFQIPSLLNQVLLPLFTLGELAKNVKTFDDLPNQTEATPPYKRNGRPWRNTTGICDDPTYVDTYNKLAKSVKDNANLPKQLINVQLSPHGVLCLLYPMINTEDFDNGIVLDNNGAVGLDLLNDPVSGYYTRESIKENRVTIQGPLRIVQDNSSFSALIARNPILKEGYSLDIDGTDYPFWGFSNVLINWEVLRPSLGFDEFFQSRGIEYSMTRTDRIMNFTSMEQTKRDVVIAESDGAASLANGDNITVPILLTDNEWQLTVGLKYENDRAWVLGYLGVVVGSSILSLGLMVVLVIKKEHELLLFRMMPRPVIQRLQKGETVIEKYDLATVAILDIVSFTRLSGQMKPIEVMQMLKSLFTVLDQLAEKHQVQNVETIGDAYIVIGGGSERCTGREGAEKTALFALDAIEAIRDLEFENSLKVCIRAGLASGMVIAGVVGKVPPKYTLFGQTVTLASKMESTSSSMRIQCSSVTYLLLRDSKNHNFALEERLDCHSSTNESSLPTWWINSKAPRTQRGFFTESLWNFTINDHSHIDPQEIEKSRHSISSESSGLIPDDSTKEDSDSLQAKQSTHSVSSESSGLIPDDSTNGDDNEEDVDHLDNGVIVVNMLGNSTGGLSSLPTSLSSKGREDNSDSSGLIQDGSDSSGLIPNDTDDEESKDDIEVGKLASEKINERHAPQKPTAEGMPVKSDRQAQVNFRNTAKQIEDESKNANSYSNWEEIAPARYDNYRNNNSSQHISLEPGESSLGDSLSRPLDMGSNKTKESDAFENYWSRLAKYKKAWEDTPDDRSEDVATTLRCWTGVETFISYHWRSIKHTYYTAFIHRSILYSAIAMFVCFTASGLAAILLLAKDAEESQRSTVLSYIEDAGRMLLTTGNKAYLPIFQMTQIVNLLDIFDTLPQEMSKANIFEKDNFSSFRNVTKFCNDATYLDPFSSMAASFKQKSNLSGVLVNIELAPAGVVCLLHPQINYEDFQDGLFLNNTSAIGFDLFNDNYSKSNDIRQSREEGSILMYGPMPLLQDKTAILKEALTIRIPIFKNFRNNSDNDDKLEFWGFATSILNWARLREEAGFDSFFKSHGAEFFMTKTDTLVNLTTFEEYQKVEIIGQSDGWESLNGGNSITGPLRSITNWEITVGFKEGFTPSWKYWGSVCVVFGSLLAAHILMTTLVATKDHKLLLYRMMPRGVIRRLQMGETVVETSTNATIFFSHIIGFKTMSGQMDPRNFMLMLNQIYGEFDKLVLKHGVNKVETIGDAYIVTCNGTETGDGRDATERVALFALDAMTFVKHYRYNDMRVFLRSGLATGPVVFGVIGAAVPKYTIFGDTVNYASRMESSSKSMKIQCSEKTAQLLRDSVDYEFFTDMRREGDTKGIEVKGKGLVQTWWIRDARKSGESGNLVGSGSGSASNRMSFLSSSKKSASFRARTDSFHLPLPPSIGERFGIGLPGGVTPSECNEDAV